MFAFQYDNVEGNIEEPHSFASILVAIFCNLQIANLELIHNFYEDLQAVWSSSSKLLTSSVTTWIVERKFLMEVALKLSET